MGKSEKNKSRNGDGINGSLIARPFPKIIVFHSKQ